MDHRDAQELIRGGVAPAPSGGNAAREKGATGAEGAARERVWADLGAGGGTFTRALAALLPPGSTVYAVDKSRRAAQALRRLRLAEGRTLVPLQADFTDPLELPPASLDGLLMANALHFAEDQAAVLRGVARHLRPRGRLLVVEYDRTRANRWVPFPVLPARLEALAAAAGLSTPREVGRRPSSYGREMYAALMRWPAASVQSTSRP